MNNAMVYSESTGINPHKTISIYGNKNKCQDNYICLSLIYPNIINITQFEFCMGGDNSTFQNWIISNFNFQQQKQSAKIIRIKLYEFE